MDDDVSSYRKEDPNNFQQRPHRCVVSWCHRSPIHQLKHSVESTCFDLISGIIFTNWWNKIAGNKKTTYMDPGNKL